MNPTVIRTLAHLIAAAVTINVPLWSYSALQHIDATHTQAAREVELRDTLWLLRRTIDQYTANRDSAPPSLGSLVEAGYLIEVPVDPMTGSADAWVVVLEEDPIAVTGERGIIDVRSGACGVDSTGQRRYSDW